MKTLHGSCHCNQVSWQFEGPIESATACNCTICRRYGALWAYGHLGEEITVAGPTTFYVRGKAVEYHFCPKCACVAYYLGIKRDESGRQKAVVNLRLANDPDLIADLVIDHFDGLDTFDDLPRDGRCIRDLWY